jgi:hypothetical protein
MSRIKTIPTYAWAFLAGPIVLVTFMGMEPLASLFVMVTGLRVHPIYAGGEVTQVINHGDYQTFIHRPVFDGLIHERDTGFVQIEWQPKDANLPERLDEQIDFDQDGKTDFRVQLSTSTNATTLEPLDSRVMSANEVVKAQNARILRVNLRKRSN